MPNSIDSRAAGLALVFLAACSGSAEVPGPAAKLQLQVAPLDLAGIDFACYDVRVDNADAQPVWQRGVRNQAWPADTTTLCSDRFGNGLGGDIAYVGPCDADGPDTDGDGLGEQDNAVTLWLDGLYAGGVDVADYQDPCPDGCRLEVSCEENSDALVTFDLTILRAAHQGFFDVAVNFDDIFCSAKLDTCHADGADADAAPDPITLLFGADGSRDATAVFGFACTAGPGADVDTLLLYSRVRVTCGTTTFALDPTGRDGNNVAVADSSAAELIYAIYRGEEQLGCGAGDCNKRYWNLAIDLADLAALGGTCTLSLEATANDGNAGFALGRPARMGLVYPYIVLDAVPLTAGGEAACQQNPLNGSDPLNGDRPSRVVTAYKGNLDGVTAPTTMCSQYDGTTAGPTDATDCGAESPRPVVALEQLTSFGDASQYSVDSAVFPVGADVLVQHGSLYRVAGGGVTDLGWGTGIMTHTPPFLQVGAALISIDGNGSLLDVDLGAGTVTGVATGAYPWFKAATASQAIVNLDLGTGAGLELYRYNRTDGLALLAGDFTPDATGTVDCSGFAGMPMMCADNGCFYREQDETCGANDPVDGLDCSQYDGRPFMCRNGGCAFNQALGTCGTGSGTLLTATATGHTQGLGGSFSHGGYVYFCVTRAEGSRVVATDLVRTDGATLSVVIEDTGFCGDEYLVDGDRAYTINVRDWADGANLMKLDLATVTPTETVLGIGFPYGHAIERSSDGRLFAVGKRQQDNLLTIYTYDGQTLSQLDDTIVAWGVNLKVIGTRVYFLAPYYDCSDCTTWWGYNMEDGLPGTARVAYVDLDAPHTVRVIDASLVPNLTNVYAPNWDAPNWEGSDALFEVAGHVFFASYTSTDGVVAVVSDGTVAGSTMFKTNAGTGGSPYTRFGTVGSAGVVYFNNYDAGGVAQLFRVRVQAP